MICASAFPLLHAPLMPTGTRLGQWTALAGIPVASQGLYRFTGVRGRGIDLRPC